jgi:hypothetical protein
MLNGFKVGVSTIQFVKSPIGWIVGPGIKDDVDNSAILQILNKLEEVEYTPAEEPIEEKGMLSSMWTSIKDFFK